MFKPSRLGAGIVVVMTNDSPRFAEAMTAFTAVVRAVPADRWTAPSPCAGWSARDVVGHVVDTQRDFLAGHDLDVGPRSNGEPPAVWADHLDTVQGLTAEDANLALTFDGAFGPTTLGATLADFYGFDAVVHRWDLARAVGLEAPFSPAELDALETAIAGFGEHLYAEGVCAPAVPVPADAPRQDRVLGLLGRDARVLTG